MADKDTDKKESESQSDKATEEVDGASTEGDSETQEAKGGAEERSQASTAAKSEDAPEKPKRQDPEQDEPAPKPSKPVSKDLEAIISKIEKLSVLELADLVHALEDRFGVTAAAPMAVAATGVAPAGSGEAVEEQTTFNVILASAGANKIAVIKAVRELVPTLGLKEAKDLVEAAPKPVMEGVNKEKANEAKTKLTAVGATVELQ